KELLPRRMLLPQHHIQPLPPLLVEFAKAAVGVTVRVGLAIFFPGELQCQMGMALEFFVELGKIRLRLAGLVGAPRGSRKHGGFQLAIIPTFRQRPGDTRLVGASQVFINRAVSDRATAGDLPLPQPQFVAQSQYFFELSHGQPLHGQCRLPPPSSGAALTVSLSSVLCLPLTARSRSLWKSFRNDPGQGSDQCRKLTGLKSESVTGFIPES